MYEDYETKKYPLELALSGLLVIVVLIARLVVIGGTVIIDRAKITRKETPLQAFKERHNTYFKNLLPASGSRILILSNAQLPKIF